MNGTWMLAAAGVFSGVCLLAAASLGGQSLLGITMMAAMSGYAAVIVAGGERIGVSRILRSWPNDERLAASAAAVAGVIVLMMSVAILTLAGLSRQDEEPFIVLVLSVAITYLAGATWAWRHR